MKKIIIAILLLTASVNANAFYNSLDHDVDRFREGLKKQVGTEEQKEAFFDQVVPQIIEARVMAYRTVVKGCQEDIQKSCSDAINNDLKVKCLSDNKAFLTSSCWNTVNKVFKKRTK